MITGLEWAMVFLAFFCGLCLGAVFLFVFAAKTVDAENHGLTVKETIEAQRRGAD